MASIVRRNKSFAVVYRYKDEFGTEKQKWESFQTKKEAQARKAEIESAQCKNTFVRPSPKTVSEFLDDFVRLYGSKKWGISMYSNQIALMKNYVIPLLGDIELQSVTPFELEKYFNELKYYPAASRNNVPPKDGAVVTAKTIEKIYKLLRCAFKQAKKWDLIAKNPCDGVTMDITKYTRRPIWDVNTIVQALNECKDSRLYVAMNLSFACSLRIGEISGLQWKNVVIDDDSIARDDAHLLVKQELERATKDALEFVGMDDIYFTFPNTVANSKTCLVLKKPKTDSSIRKVWIPKTLAYILREWKNSQDAIKECLGDEYEDYDLVICQANGRPCEHKLIEKSFAKLKIYAKLPDVVFHSLRHSSTTYKLKLNHGDIKATQGDTGHAQADMVMEVYAHIVDEDRKVNASRFQESFYAEALNCIKPNQSRTSEAETPRELDVNHFIAALQNSPELRQKLLNILSQT